MFIALGALFVLGIDVLLVIFAGILFGVFLRSLAFWVASKTPLTQTWALAVVVVALIASVGIPAWLTAPDIAEQARELREVLPRSIERLTSRAADSEAGRAVMKEAPAPKELIPPQRDILGMVQGLFGLTTAALANAVAIFFLGVFLAASPRTYVNGVVALVPKQRVDRARQVLNELGKTLANWLIGQSLSMAIVGISTTLGLWALGIPLAFVLGLIAALLAFIPNIGPVISAVPAVLVALLESPTKALWVVGLYVAVQLVESYVISPLIQKKMVSLPPALTLSAQLLFGILMGGLAFALATPMAAAALVLVRMLYIEDVLGKRPITVE